jgi:hypothetical protein
MPTGRCTSSQAPLALVVPIPIGPSLWHRPPTIASAARGLSRAYRRVGRRCLGAPGPSVWMQPWWWAKAVPTSSPPTHRQLHGPAESLELRRPTHPQLFAYSARTASLPGNREVDHFESSVTPLLSRVAPSNTYVIGSVAWTCMPTPHSRGSTTSASAMLTTPSSSSVRRLTLATLPTPGLAARAPSRKACGNG